MPTFFEFFAGGGMVREGLGEEWTCKFANDFDRKKCETYRRNFGAAELVCGDIREIRSGQMPKTPHLVWASFPCQDLSLAGGGAGLRGDRSGTFWPFWDQVKALSQEGPRPDLIVLENVCGTLTSHQGKDFGTIVAEFRKLGFYVGAMVIDAELFVPQSRPRLFFVAVSSKDRVPERLIEDSPHELWHPPSLRRAYMRLSPADRTSWVWWQMPSPPPRATTFASIVEPDPMDVCWHSTEDTKRLLGMMTTLHKKRVEQAKRANKKMVGAIYKRTRRTSEGEKVQRAEIRFDDVAGCLRTPAGGSSRQTLMIVDGKHVRTRLISARETARLMGLPDSYVLPQKYNEAYHLTGDGVVVPVVRYLSKNLLLPALEASVAESKIDLHPMQTKRSATAAN